MACMWPSQMFVCWVGALHVKHSVPCCGADLGHCVQQKLSTVLVVSRPAALQLSVPF